VNLFPEFFRPTTAEDLWVNLSMRTPNWKLTLNKNQGSSIEIARILLQVLEKYKPKGEKFFKISLIDFSSFSFACFIKILLRIN
jgi:hypothetical protein